MEIASNSGPQGKFDSRVKFPSPTRVRTRHLPPPGSPDRPGFKPQPGFEPKSDPGFQQRSGIGGGRPFIVNTWSTPKSLILFLFSFSTQTGHGEQSSTWIVDCRVAEADRKEAFELNR